MQAGPYLITARSLLEISKRKQREVGILFPYCALMFVMSADLQNGLITFKTLYQLINKKEDRIIYSNMQARHYTLKVLCNDS